MTHAATLPPMSPAGRMKAALTLKVPDRVPTFELEFQLTDELVGQDYLRQSQLDGVSSRDRERLIRENAELIITIYEKLGHDAICLHHLDEAGLCATAREIRRLVGDKFLLLVHGDGTFAIPDGSHMLDFAYRMADEPEALHAQALAMMTGAIERNKRMLAGGLDGFILCSDYCFNQGPFLSPSQFAEFITPYLARIIENIRAGGGFAIKHTDGNIMPILDQLVACRPHALHSLDPMAGVDIREVKHLAGRQVALAGNVHCAALQTGTDDDVIASARYAMTHGKPGGGYIFCTSNIPFKGMRLERYQLAFDVYLKDRDYTDQERLENGQVNA